MPVLSWTNGVDKDGDAITYRVIVHLAVEPHWVLEAEGNDIEESPTGTTSWTVPIPLKNHAIYAWHVEARDPSGALGSSPTWEFKVNVGNHVPTEPSIVSPPVGGQSSSANTALTILNSTDEDNDLITHVFEIDSVNTFDSSDRRNSGEVIPNGSGSTTWVTPALEENRRYWWRVKAQDGRSESAWVIGSFLVNAVNEPPPTPTVKNPSNGGWVTTKSATLEVNPVVDPDGDVVHYEFELYFDTLEQLATSRSSDTTALIVGVITDSRYWWRVRAVDTHGAASAWSPFASFSVNAADALPPAIGLTEPSQPIAPTVAMVDGSERKQVTLTWDGVNPAAEQTVALYYATSRFSQVGTLIVDGLRQPHGATSGSYVWDVSKLGTGTYYPFARIYDERGIGRADAPGAVVIPSAQQADILVVPFISPIGSVSSNSSLTYLVYLSKAPSAPVVVPIASTDPSIGVAVPAQLDFTSANWSVPQRVQVTAANDCVPTDAKGFDVLHGKVVSTDPNYIGVSRKAAVNYLAGPPPQATTTDPDIGICNITIVSEQMISPDVWESTWRAELVNKGSTTIKGVTAKVRSVALPVHQWINDALVFGAVAPGETVKSNGTFVVRTPNRLIPNHLFIPAVPMGRSFFWDVTSQR